MKQQDLAARLARRARTSKAVAADRLDRIVHKIIAELKKGNPVSLPGLGTFKPGKKLNFQFEKSRAPDLTLSGNVQLTALPSGTEQGPSARGARPRRQGLREKKH